MCNRNLFSITNIFSKASRERCLVNLKKTSYPPIVQGKSPTTKAAVLVPLCTVDCVPSLLYTVRASNLRTSGGQVAFPGGQTDGDESPVETALRETYEEIGLSGNRIDIWGQALPIQGGQKRTLITPVIGSIANLNEVDLEVNPKEVSEIFTIPIEALCDPKNQYYTQFRNGYVMPVFIARRYKIWGVTAYITHIFLNSVLSKEIYNNDWTKKKIVRSKLYCD